MRELGDLRRERLALAGARGPAGTPSPAGAHRSTCACAPADARGRAASGPHGRAGSGTQGVALWPDLKWKNLDHILVEHVHTGKCAVMSRDSHVTRMESQPLANHIAWLCSNLEVDGADLYQMQKKARKG